MTGAVLDLLAHSSSENKENNILVGNPKITQFKSSYKKHTPFSMQKFRIDHNKLRHLQENLSTKMEFEIPRNGFNYTGLYNNQNCYLWIIAENFEDVMRSIAEKRK